MEFYRIDEPSTLDLWKEEMDSLREENRKLKEAIKYIWRKAFNKNITKIVFNWTEVIEIWWKWNLDKSYVSAIGDKAFITKVIEKWYD